MESMVLYFVLFLKTLPPTFEVMLMELIPVKENPFVDKLWLVPMVLGYMFIMKFDGFMLYAIKKNSCSGKICLAAELCLVVLLQILSFECFTCFFVDSKYE